jgi:hypothetical protein
MHQWIAIFGAPTAFLFELSAAYALAPVACRHGTPAIVHVLIASTCVLCIAAGLYAWRYSLPVRPGTDVCRHNDYAGFVRTLGAALSALTLLALLAQWITLIIMPACA